MITIVKFHNFPHFSSDSTWKKKITKIETVVFTGNSLRFNDEKNLNRRAQNNA